MVKTINVFIRQNGPEGQGSHSPAAFRKESEGGRSCLGVVSGGYCPQSHREGGSGLRREGCSQTNPSSLQTPACGHHLEGEQEKKKQVPPGKYSPPKLSAWPLGARSQGGTVFPQSLLVAPCPSLGVSICSSFPLIWWEARTGHRASGHSHRRGRV